MRNMREMDAQMVLMRYADGERDFSYILCYQGDFNGKTLDFADFSFSSMQECDFRAASMLGVNAYRANFMGSDFNGADLSSAEFRRAVLTNCDLSDANMSGTILDMTEIDKKTLGLPNPLRAETGADQ